MSANFYINATNGFLHCHTPQREIIIPSAPYTGALARPIVAGEIRVAINGNSRELVWAKANNEPLRALRSNVSGGSSRPEGSLYVMYVGSNPVIQFVGQYPGGRFAINLLEASNFTPPGGSGALPGDETSPEPPDPNKFMHYTISGNTARAYWYNGTSSNQVDTFNNVCDTNYSLALTSPFTHNGSTYYGGYTCVYNPL